MALISPCCPERFKNDKSWQAVRRLCDHYGLSYDDIRRELEAFHAQDLSRQQERRANENLLMYYRDLYMAEEARVAEEGGAPKRQHLFQFARVVFCLPFETVLIESLFSIMNRNKSADRASMNDETVAAGIHCRDFAPVLDDPREPYQDFERGRGVLLCDVDHTINWTDY